MSESKAKMISGQKRAFPESDRASSGSATKKTPQSASAATEKGASDDDFSTESESSISEKAIASAKKPKPIPEDIPWSKDIHRAFVEAVFRTGIRQASPSVLLENMEDKQQLTTERVKSHLQKYRNKSRRSHLEFMQEYDSFMSKSHTIGSCGGPSPCVDPRTLLRMMGVDQVLGAEVAALLSYASMEQDARQGETAKNGNQFNTAASARQSSDQTEHQSHVSAPLLSPVELLSGSHDFNNYFAGSEIMLPMLTPNEQKSPLGQSINHVVGLFYSLTHQLMALRAAKGGVTIQQKQHPPTKSERPRIQQPTETTITKEVDGKPHARESTSSTVPENPNASSLPPKKDAKLRAQHQTKST